MTDEQKAMRAANLAKARAMRGLAADPEPKPEVREPDAEDVADDPVEQDEAEPDLKAEAAAARRKRLLGDLDADTAALFSDEELEKIEVEEHDKAVAEMRKLAFADVRATARQRARADHDLIPASQLRSEAERKRLNEQVRFKVTLPRDGAGHRGQGGFRVDGRLYQIDRIYTVSRAEFESLQSNHYRAWLNEIRFKTLDQHKAGGSAEEILAQTAPVFEVAA